MLGREKCLYYFVGVGFFIGFVFRTVKCKSNECQKTDKKLNCKARYNVPPKKLTWEEAKTYCSNRNQSLLDFTDHDDLQCIDNLIPLHSDFTVWIGLKKNASNLTEISANLDDFSKVGTVCESADKNGQFRHDSCTDNLPSVCMKQSDDCKNCSKENNSQCFLPVYDKLTYFGAFAHCKRSARKLYPGNFSRCKDSVFNTSGRMWTGRLYENTIDADAKWKWLNGSLFEEWNKWEIIITDVGCSGCSFVRNGTIYLTSNCSQNLSYFCNSSDTFAQRQVSWEDAKSRCPRLQNNTFLMNRENKSYWFGIHKENACKTRMVKDPASVTEIRPKKCYYVGHSNGSYGEQDCHEKNYAICVKSAKTQCPEPLQHFNECCHRNYSAEKNWCNDHDVPQMDKCGIIGLKMVNNRTTFNCSLLFCQWDENGYCNITVEHNKTFHCDCKKEGNLTCPSNWKLAHNGFGVGTQRLCWRVFDKVRMTWQASRTFCLQHDSRLANSIDVQVINETSSFWNDGKRYWIYPSRDPLEGWYWLDGKPFIASNKRGLYEELSYTGREKRCAVIRGSKNVWKDSRCDVLRSFICKKKFFNLRDQIVESLRRILPYKLTSSEQINSEMRPSLCRNTSLEKTLFNVTEEVVKLVNSSSCMRKFKETIYPDFLDVEVQVTTNLTLLKKKPSTPNITIGNLCQNRSDCIVKSITVNVKNVLVNCDLGKSSVALADIIVLDFIANSQRVKKLEKNEFASLYFRRKKPNVTRKQGGNCFFLNRRAEWSNKGMKVGSTNRKNIVCLTDHLSSFTMVVLGAEDTENKVALDIIYYIGSALSLAGLFFSCIIYILLYKDLQILTSSRLLVHFNLQIALGLTQIVFLTGGVATQNEVACKVVAILLHYFSLAGFTWILLEAAMLYLKLISVYRGEFVKMKKFLLFGWGFPVLFVGLSASVKIDAYGADRWCWLSYEDGFVWVFFAPVLIVILISLVTVIAVMRLLFIASKSEQADVMKKIISSARAVVMLFPILGLSWAFSVIAVNHDFLLWKYLFAIFTSIQGFMIFLFYGVCNTEIRRAVGRKLGYGIGIVNPATSITK